MTLCTVFSFLKYLISLLATEGFVLRCPLSLLVTFATFDRFFLVPPNQMTKYVTSPCSLGKLQKSIFLSNAMVKVCFGIGIKST